MKVTILAAILASVTMALPMLGQEQGQQAFTQVYQDQNTGLYYEFDHETQEYFQVDPASLDFYPADEEDAANFQAAVEAEKQEYDEEESVEEIGYYANQDQDEIEFEDASEFEEEYPVQDQEYLHRAPSFQAAVGQKFKSAAKKVGMAPPLKHTLGMNSHPTDRAAYAGIKASVPAGVTGPARETHIREGVAAHKAGMLAHAHANMAGSAGTLAAAGIRRDVRPEVGGSVTLHLTPQEEALKKHDIDASGMRKGANTPPVASQAHRNHNAAAGVVATAEHALLDRPNHPETMNHLRNAVAASEAAHRSSAVAATYHGSAAAADVSGARTGEAAAAHKAAVAGTIKGMADIRAAGGAVPLKFEDDEYFDEADFEDLED